MVNLIQKYVDFDYVLPDYVEDRVSSQEIDCKDNCRRYIKEFIEAQFPVLYREQAEAMISFMEAYYEFEEETRYQFLNESSCMQEKDDIDTTLDEFVVFFKNKYMKDMPFTNSVDNRFIVKNIFDLYQSKGTERSLKLLMQIMYGESIDVYYPGRDVLRPSHSIWYKPTYLEVSHSELTKTLVGKRIYGQTSGAKAFVESVITKRINETLIDVIYLSDVKGTFTTNEYVWDGTNNTSLFSFPYTLGSMSEVVITSSDYGFSIGDLLDVRSSSGDFGIVKVSDTIESSVVLNFNLQNAGFGFTPTAYANGDPILDSLTKIYVSDSALNIANSNLKDGDKIYQYFEILQLDNNITAAVGDTITSGTIAGKIYSISGSTCIVEVSPINSFETSTSVVINGTTYNIVSCDQNTVNATVMESNALNVWAYDTINGPFKSNTIYDSLVYDQNGTSYVLSKVYSGSGASFEITSLTNEEFISYYTDIIGSNNVFGVPYLTITLDSPDFGFPKPNNIGLTSTLSTIIEDAFGIANTTIGTPAVLSFVNTGSNYNADVKIKIESPIIMQALKYDLIMTVDSSVSFVPGQIITQGTGPAKGIIQSVDIDNKKIVVRPLSYMYDFDINTVTIHDETGKTFIPIAIERDLTSYIMGNNMIVTAKAQASDGEINTVKVLTSGYGFEDGEIVTLYPHDKTKKPAYGIARKQAAGISGGTWLTKTSHLNWSTYIHDNYYYQEYSYDISSSYSLDKYKDVIENITHVAGVAMFGSVVKNVVYNEEYIFDASIEIL